MMEEHERYLLTRVQRGDGCWPWLGYITHQGYGIANLGRTGRVMAHRAVYQLLVGPIPEGLQLDHQCHNSDANCAGGVGCLHRRCVNPSHLEPATAGENTRRGKTLLAQNLTKTTCPRGHIYDRTDRRGWRRCTTCTEDQRTQRRRAAGAQPSRVGASHCARGHEFTEENTRHKGTTARACKACARNAERALRAARRQPQEVA